MRSDRSSASPIEPGNLRLVGEVEARLDAGFERELADEGQTERVDRRDGDVAEPLAQLLPLRRRQLRGAAGLLQPLDDPLPHLGGGLPRERDREDAIGIDAREQQIDVALDEDARLPRPRRRFEDDVLRRIDGVRRASASNIADVVLAADGRVTAEAAEEHVLRRRRKLAALDAVDGVDELLLRRRRAPACDRSAR